MLERLCYSIGMNTSKKKRPRDINELAASIEAEATSGKPAEEESPIKKPAKNPAAVILGRLGGLKGGRARAKNLTPEERKEIARIAALARWKKTDH